MDGTESGFGASFKKLLGDDSSQYNDKFQFASQMLPRWHFRRGVYGGGATPLVYNPAWTSAFTISGLNAFLFMCAAWTIMRYMNQTKTCIEPFVYYDMMICTLCIFSAFYFFLISNEEMCTDVEWMRHLGVVVTLSLCQILTMSWGFNMVLLSNPFMKVEEMEMSDSVCFRDVPDFYNNNFVCTILLLFVLGYTLWVIYFKFVPDIGRQLKQLKDFR